MGFARVGMGATATVGGPIELGGATSGTPREDLKPTPTPAAEPLTRWSHPALFKLGRRWAWYRCRVLLMPVRTGSSQAPG